MSGNTVMHHLAHPITLTLTAVACTLFFWAPKFGLFLQNSNSLLKETELLMIENSIENKYFIETNLRKIEILTPFNDDLLLLNIIQDARSLSQERLETSVTEVARRNARNSKNSALLLKLHVINEDWAKAVQQVSVNFRLDAREGRRPYYASILSKAFRTNEGRNLINQSIADGPNWGWDWILTEIYAGDLDVLRRLNRTIRLYAPNLTLTQSNLLYKLYFKSLVSSNDTEYAFENWSKIFIAPNTVVDPASNSIVFNTKFDNDSSPPPFNWEVFKENKTNLWFEQPQGLKFVTSNRKYFKSFQQLVRVQGLKQVKLKVIGGGFSGQGTLLVRMVCQNTKKIILDKTIGSIELSSGMLEIEYSNLDIEPCDFAYLQSYVKTDPGSTIFKGTITSLSVCNSP